MTEKLRAVLTETAEQAGSYADADRSIAMMRRRRARRLAIAAPLAVVTAVSGVFLGSQLLRPPGPDGVEVAVTPAAFPSAVSAPSAPKRLPDTAVGAASFIYSLCARDCGYFVVLPDGKQYAISDDRTSPTKHFSLSPTGKWLAENTVDGVRFRDLEDREARELLDTGPGRSEVWAWSPDGLWALIVRHTDGAVHHFQAVRVADGVSHKAVSDVVPKAVSNDGAVLYWAKTERADAELVQAEIAGGKLIAQRRFSFDIAGSLQDTEVPNFGTWELGRGGGISMLTVQQPTPSNDLGAPSAVLLLGLQPGDTTVNRLSLPSPENSDAQDYWSPQVVEGTSVYAVNSRNDRTRIVVVDTATNVVGTLTTLPPDSIVVLRGDAS